MKKCLVQWIYDNETKLEFSVINLNMIVQELPQIKSLDMIDVKWEGNTIHSCLFLLMVNGKKLAEKIEEQMIERQMNFAVPYEDTFGLKDEDDLINFQSEHGEKFVFLNATGRRSTSGSASEESDNVNEINQDAETTATPYRLAKSTPQLPKCLKLLNDLKRGHQSAASSPAPSTIGSVASVPQTPVGGTANRDLHTLLIQQNTKVEVMMTMIQHLGSRIENMEATVRIGWAGAGRNPGQQIPCQQIPCQQSPGQQVVSRPLSAGSYYNPVRANAHQQALIKSYYTRAGKKLRTVTKAARAILDKRYPEGWSNMALPVIENRRGRFNDDTVQMDREFIDSAIAQLQLDYGFEHGQIRKTLANQITNERNRKKAELRRQQQQEDQEEEEENNRH